MIRICSVWIDYIEVILHLKLRIHDEIFIFLLLHIDRKYLFKVDAKSKITIWLLYSAYISLFSFWDLNLLPCAKELYVVLFILFEEVLLAGYIYNFKGVEILIIHTFLFLAGYFSLDLELSKKLKF